VFPEIGVETADRCPGDRRLGDQTERPGDDTESLEAAKREPLRFSAFEGANVEGGTCHGAEA
jgi:hypothetical protein